MTRVNPAAERIFGRPELAGQRLPPLLALAESGDAPRGARRASSARAPRASARCGSRVGSRRQGRSATDSRPRRRCRASICRRQLFYTLILRNVNERLEAERRIRALTVETEYLREELAALGGFDEILGASEALRGVLQDVEQVAATDATVLDPGRDRHRQGAGRARHPRAQRAARAAARQGELRGHPGDADRERALRPRARRLHRRDAAPRRAASRWPTAGTIFLDEIGELPTGSAGEAPARAPGGRVRAGRAARRRARSTCA